MRAEIVAGADALAAQWNNWTGGAVAGITRNSFKIGPDKWTDLAKALNILNRISVKAQTDEGEDHAAVPFDGAFVDNRLAGPGAARTAVKENMATHNALFAGELG
jgi:hypothetical protein